MYFKNLQLYKFTRPFDTPADALEKALASFIFAPCGNQDMSKFGWVPPLSRQSESLVHEANGQLLLCAQLQEKILPPQVIKDILDESVQQLEGEQRRFLKKKEKDALREEIIHALLPRAFCRNSFTFMWINPAEQTIAIDTSSGKKADDILSLLRKCLGSLPAVPYSLQNPLEITMTEWVKDGKAPDKFTFDDRATLRSALEHGGIITAKEQDLVGEEIKAAIDADKYVTKLAMSWNDTISFELDDSLAIKRLKFSSELREQNDDLVSETEEDRNDADFVLMTGTLTNFIGDLISVAGGAQTE